MDPGAYFNIKTILPGIGISIIKIRQPWDCLIFIMGIHILVRRHLYIETSPCFSPSLSYRHQTIAWTTADFSLSTLNTLRPRQNGRHFADDTFKRIFLDKDVRISIKISLKFVHKGPINNNPALVQIMAWRRSGDKPLSEPMMVSLLTHICVTRPQWVNMLNCFKDYKKYIHILNHIWDLAWPK